MLPVHPSQVHPDAQLVSFHSKPSLVDCLRSINTLVIKAHQDRSSLIGHPVNPGQDHPSSCLELQLSFSTSPPALYPLNPSHHPQGHIHATVVIINLTSDLRINSFKLQSTLVPDHRPSQFQFGSGSLSRPSRPLLSIEEIKVLHQHSSSAELDQSFGSRFLATFYGPVITMVFKLIHASLNSQNALGAFPERFRRSLISFSHRTVERAENKANQYRIMEKEFLRAIKSDIERLLHFPDPPSPASGHYSPSSMSYSPKTIGLRRFEPSATQNLPESPIRGLGIGVIPPSPAVFCTQTDRGSDLNNESVKSNLPTSPTMAQSDGRRTVYPRNLLHAFVVCLIFQFYWTTVNLISWIELTITQLAYRSVLWLGPTRHERRSSGTNLIGISPRSKKGPNKILKISTALTSRDKPAGQLSSIMKIPAMDSLDIGQSLGRGVRSVSWEAGSLIDEEMNGNGIERQLHHVRRKDSKVLPKSPKPHAGQSMLDNRISKPKIMKMALNSPSKKLNVNPSESSDADSMDEEDEDEDERTIIVDHGNSSSDSENTESQETPRLLDILNRSRNPIGQDFGVSDVGSEFVPESSSGVELDDDVTSSRAESLHGDDSGPVMVVRTKGFGMVGPFDTDDEDDGLESVGTRQQSGPPRGF